MSAATDVTTWSVTLARSNSSASGLVIAVRSSTAMGPSGAAAHAVSRPCRKFCAVSAGSAVVISPTGIVHCTASWNSSCLLPKCLITDALSTPDNSAMPRMVAFS